MGQVGRRFKLVWWMVIWGVLLVLAVAAAFMVVKSQIRRIQASQAAERFQNTLEIYVETVDSSMKGIEKYLYLSLENSTDVLQMEGGRRDLQYFISRQNISVTLNRILGFYSDISALIYYPGTDGSGCIFASSIGNYEEKKSIEKVFWDGIGDKENQLDALRRGYDFCFTENGTYLLKYYKLGNNFFGIVLSSEMVFSELSGFKEEDGIELCMLDDSGNVLASTMPMEDSVSLSENGSFIDTGSGRYLMSGEMSGDNAFFLAALIREDVVYSQGRRIDNMIALLFVIILILLPMSISFIRRFIARPIEDMATRMQMLGEGNFEVRMQSNSRVREYCVLEEAFNHMSKEIKNLKIKNYEIQIKKQKAELQYLQLQISPHFYLNALNIIYSLAQMKDYKKIQKMTLHLVNYSRYMFHDVQALVTLEEELKHVREYIEIQKMRFLNFTLYQEKIDERLRNMLIPAFILQSFVENSIKYGLREKQNGCLQITAEMSSREKNTVILTVRDDGNGYAPEVLEEINSNTVPDDSEKDIGIRNVKERLTLIYKNKASVRLYNDNGAVSEIKLPLVIQE